jgi:hypothetical protein
LAFSSAIGEELLFRAVLQPELGLLASSLLFALVHVPFERDLLLWPLFAFAVGLLLGALFWWSGAVMASVSLHMVVNLLNLVRITRHSEGTLDRG